MVDELDRCSDKTISEFFDALQLFLSVEDIVIILSVNYTSVCYSLAENHKHYFDEKIENKDKIKFGMEYLKKYINIPIHLTAIPSYGGYITYILNEIDNTKDSSNIDEVSCGYEVKEPEYEENDKFSDVFEEEEKAFINTFLDWVNKKKHITPREVKTIINILVISKDICIFSNQLEYYDEKINFKKYIRWFMFQYFNNITALNIIKESNYNKHKHKTIKEFLESLSGKDKKNLYVEDEKIGKLCIRIIHDIRIEEISIFSYVSSLFMYNPEL